MTLSQTVRFMLFTFTVFTSFSSIRAEEKKPPLSISAGKGGFLLTSPDGDFVIKFRGYIQTDGRFFLEDQPSAVDTFVIRRARPILEGTLYKYFDFKIMPDFGGGVTVLQEAYMDAKFDPAFKVRFGKMKSPVGLERLQSALNLELIERSFVTSIVPNRDVGVYLFGDLAANRVYYAIGVFNGVVDGGSADQDTGEGKDAEARIFFRPLSGLGVGISATYGNQDGALLIPSLPVYRTSGQQIFFRYRLSTALETTTIADGTRYRFSPQLTFYRGPLGILAEYAFSSQEMRQGIQTAEIGNDAFNLTAGYVLTGEPASYEGISPEHPFDIQSGNFGAFEIAFRYSQLNIDDEAFPVFTDPLISASEARNFALGLNWYLNKNVKFVFNYDQTNFEDGSLKTEKLFLTRFQIGF